jgi:Bacterial regulatory proteins, luxR family
VRIAHRLSIGLETVPTHAPSIYRKLGIASRRELGRLSREDPIAVNGDRRGKQLRHLHRVRGRALA